MRFRKWMMFAALCAPFPAAAAGVVVSGAWARATPPGARTAAAYLTLRSATDDRLVQITTPAAARAIAHDETMADGMLHMQALTKGIALPAGQSVVLQPGGRHVMLEALKIPLVAGQTLTLRLTFLHAAPETLVLPIEPIGASGPGPQ